MCVRPCTLPARDNRVSDTMVGVAAPTEEAAAEGGGEGHRGVSQVVIDEFTKHANAMRESSRARRDAVRLRSVVDDDHDAVAVDIRDTLGVPQPQDKWQGCTNLRTLRTLLSIVDDRGFERSPHQIAFHSAFERCVSRVVYKKDWGTSRPAIMRKNEWKRCSSEVLISTPRRFGKTFSIAIFCACLALSFGTEIVVFSPARRASRKLLERMVEQWCMSQFSPVCCAVPTQPRVHMQVHPPTRRRRPYCGIQPRAVPREVVRRQVVAHPLLSK